MVRPAEPGTRLQLDAQPAAHDTYRGALKVVLSGSSARVVNRVGLDDYLRGVLPVEMPSSWPGAALRAQAVAARSYAVRRLHPGSGAFDLYDDTRTQVYLGAEAETDRTNAIIDAAPGRSSSRDGTTARSTPSTTRPAAARPRTTSTRSSGRRER